MKRSLLGELAVAFHRLGDSALRDRLLKKAITGTPKQRSIFYSASRRANDLVALADAAYRAGSQAQAQAAINAAEQAAAKSQAAGQITGEQVFFAADIARVLDRYGERNKALSNLRKAATDALRRKHQVLAAKELLAIAEAANVLKQRALALRWLGLAHARALKAVKAKRRQRPKSKEVGMISLLGASPSAEGTLLDVIKAYAEFGAMSRAQRLGRELTSYRRQELQKQLTLSYARAGNVKKALAVLGKIKNRKLSYVVSDTLTALVKNKRCKQAQQFADKVRGWEPHEGLVVYAQQCHGSVGKPVLDRIEYLVHFNQLYFQKAPTIGKSPALYLVAAMAEIGHYSRALELVAKLRGPELRAAGLAELGERLQNKGGKLDATAKRKLTSLLTALAVPD